MAGTTEPAGDVKACCVSGYIHSGRPGGEETKIAGVDAYVARPASPSVRSGMRIYWTAVQYVLSDLRKKSFEGRYNTNLQ